MNQLHDFEKEILKLINLEAYTKLEDGNIKYVDRISIHIHAGYLPEVYLEYKYMKSNNIIKETHSISKFLTWEGKE